MPATIDNPSASPHPGPWSPTPVPLSVLRRSRSSASVRRFYHVLLATVISTLVVVGDRMVDAWTSGGLLLALVVLWLAVFTSLSLFSRVLERLALAVMTPRRRAPAA
ncbi:MAG: hypothetical protein KA164_17610 [Rhodoferax sp.]|nr:hypothetical protein [Rhodoferax sp.]